MRVKGQDNRRTANLARTVSEFAKNLLVAQVYPIEVSDGQYRGGDKFWKGDEIGNHMHGPQTLELQCYESFRDFHLTIGLAFVQEKTRHQGLSWRNRPAAVKSVDKAIP